MRIRHMKIGTGLLGETRKETGHISTMDVDRGI